MQNTRFGDNRTGLSANPDLSHEMLEGMEAFPPTSVGDEADLVAEMSNYVDADLVDGEGGLGSVPQPNQMPQDVDEDSWALFVDKLGERLAFERSGVRLYEGVIAKLEAYGELPAGPDLETLERLRDEELEHFHGLEDAMLEIGADPTAVTPSADVAGVMATGICQVVSDPRASLLASLEAVLVAELADGECWEALIELAVGVGQGAMAQRFEVFVEEEQEHRMLVRTWIAAAQGRAAPPTGQ